jgi:hypothetical protein
MPVFAKVISPAIGFPALGTGRFAVNDKYPRIGVFLIAIVAIP